MQEPLAHAGEQAFEGAGGQLRALSYYGYKGLACWALVLLRVVEYRVVEDSRFSWKVCMSWQAYLALAGFPHQAEIRHEPSPRFRPTSMFRGKAQRGLTRNRGIRPA